MVLLIGDENIPQFSKIINSLEAELDNKQLIYVKFLDNSKNMYYEGYWHKVRNCNYGWGVEYLLKDRDIGSKYKCDVNKPKIRYKYFG